jgi:hypothetical protein
MGQSSRDAIISQKRQDALDLKNRQDRNAPAPAIAQGQRDTTSLGALAASLRPKTPELKSRQTSNGLGALAVSGLRRAGQQ